MNPLSFLERVYGNDPGWIDLPAKVQDRWIPFYTEWHPQNGTKGVVSRRVRSSIRDKEDLYFSVVQFREKGRRHEQALPGRWLFADLDLVAPDVCVKAGVKPTICWQSSPGHFQALWELSKRLKPQSLEKLNRMLTYALKADRSGWDLTQVLRIPGTRNYKYPSAPEVGMLFSDGPTYDAKVLFEKLRKVVPVPDGREKMRNYQPLTDWEVPAKARSLLRRPADQVVEGERSEVLWKIECLLVEAGVPEEAIFDLIWPSAWNKHADVNTGATQLRREIGRAIRHVQRREVTVEETGEQVSNNGTALPEGPGEDEFVLERTLNPTGYGAFMSQPLTAPRWMIEDIWTEGSPGIIGGEPKTSKSTLALALGLSVASGRPFLGHFPVHTTGPVLIVQEENSDSLVQDRLARIAASYGLIPRSAQRLSTVPDPGLVSGGKVLSLEMPHDIDLWLVNHYGFNLADEDHWEALVSDIERVRPALLILDPLYLMLGSADENKSHELRPFLQRLLQLRYNYELAIAVVHHFRKQQTNGGVAVRAGQRLMGNATLHGWVESSLYVEAVENDDLDPGALSVRVQPELRNMAPRPALDIVLRMGDPGDLDFEAEVNGVKPGDDLLRAVGDGCSLTELARTLGIAKSTAKRRAEASGCKLYKRTTGTTAWRYVAPPPQEGEGGEE